MWRFSMIDTNEILILDPRDIRIEDNIKTERVLSVFIKFPITKDDTIVKKEFQIDIWHGYLYKSAGYQRVDYAIEDGKANVCATFVEIIRSDKINIQIYFTRMLTGTIADIVAIGTFDKLDDALLKTLPNRRPRSNAMIEEDILRVLERSKNTKKVEKKSEVLSHNVDLLLEASKQIN